MRTGAEGGGIAGNAAGAASRFSAGYAGNKTAWQNLSPAEMTRVQNTILGGVRPATAAANAANPRTWIQDHPQRAQEFNDLAGKVRNRWNDHSQAIGGDWWSKNHPAAAQNRIANGVRPGSDWWSKDHPQLANWYYHHDWHNHDWQYWWGGSSWDAADAWLTAWGLAGGPMYYDYGAGGNVVYQGNNVYVNGQNVGTDDQYAQSAADIAAVPAAVAPAQNGAAATASATKEEWLPLGTFAVIKSKQDADPTRFLQIAVDRQGIVSGTMHNSSTDKSYIVQGRVDKQSQRVAMTIGDNSDVVMETGLYNLTQPEAPALVHYGTTRNETMLLVRLDAPKSSGSTPSQQKQ
jgi:hypothetical protein